MLRGTDARTVRFLNGLAEINRRLNEAQIQVTSGKRINKVSDSPDEISRLLQVRSQLSANEQVQANLSRIQGETDAAEQVLQQVVLLMDRIAVLGAQGASATVDAGQRATLGDEVASILNQVVGLANTAMDGRYLFSGDADQNAPYDLDLQLDAPFSAYQGTVSTRQVQHPSGRPFAVGTTAEEIFDNSKPGASVFQAVNQLRLALRDNDSQAIKDAEAAVRTASAHLNNQLSYYGSVQNQVAAAIDYGNRQTLRLKTQISDIQDADATAAILELNQMQFEQQATLATEGRRTQTSLFDFLR